MKLLTKAIEKTLPKMGKTEKLPNSKKLCRVKFFNPCGSGTWYGIEWDPETREFFGYVTGLGCNELGYFSLDELANTKLRWGLGIERDLHWTPTSLEMVMDREPAGL